ncbi:puromycin resistance protein pur8 [Metarhizium robertsii ARSEF 23]|uniref:Puromycin resistance protein pur8 n=1 Tax=Metarhizium robertsii (strain ARSEF 23 / ATCC MYA-3075) TaxID=655844 RepID=E9F4A6_METRA|nr:puromycin resistance protein pur8 [Metarhizium robertsii ARSEF 23]EFY97463.1 puromycin resistance protein pur8 [Metarhizium robertsii ARSEF 23]
MPQRASVGGGQTAQPVKTKRTQGGSHETLHLATPVGGMSNMQRQDEALSVPTPPEFLPANSSLVDNLPLTLPNTLSVSKIKGITVIVTLAGISFLNTMGSGILIAALPRIASDVELSDALILWPAAVYALAAGCLLLIFGAAADAIGAKIVWITGSYLFVVFTVALGLANTGLQVILFRTFLGVAISMCLPTAVSLITNTFPKGTWRNVAFAMNGMGQPLGYALGLVLGGIFTDSIGWRWAYYMMAIINFVLSTASIWSLPDVKPGGEKRWTKRLAEDIDWAGAAIMSVALGLLLGRPALIPNSLWKNAPFTTICLKTKSQASREMPRDLANRRNSFQQVEGLPALQSSLRFLPHVIMGICVNAATAYLISRVQVQTLAVVSALITVVAPALMATIKVGENYWYAPFWALFLSPVNPDVLFTVSNLIISDAFPVDTQSLAGGVFSEVSQFGNSVGLAVTAAIAASVTEHAGSKDTRIALMDGFRAAFWTIFVSAAGVAVICFFGLRRGGFIGKKDN